MLAKTEIRLQWRGKAGEVDQESVSASDKLNLTHCVIWKCLGEEIFET